MSEPAEEFPPAAVLDLIHEEHEPDAEPRRLSDEEMEG